MQPARLDLTVTPGDTWRRTLYFEVDSVAMVMTGMTWRAEVRSDWLPEGQLMGTFDVSVNTGTSEVTLVLPHTVTKNFPSGSRLVWDLQSTNGSGDVQTWLQGQVKVGREATD